jgi:hypothetical protein
MESHRESSEAIVSTRKLLIFSIASVASCIMEGEGSGQSYGDCYFFSEGKRLWSRRIRGCVEMTVDRAKPAKAQGGCSQASRHLALKRRMLCGAQSAPVLCITWDDVLAQKNLGNNLNKSGTGIAPSFSHSCKTRSVAVPVVSFDSPKCRCLRISFDACPFSPRSFKMVYIRQRSLPKLREYKYASVDKSLVSKYILKPFYTNVAIRCFPMSMA